MRILIIRLLVLLDSRLAQIDRENILIAKSLNVSVKWHIHPLDQRQELTKIALKRQAQQNHRKFYIKNLEIHDNCNN